LCKKCQQNPSLCYSVATDSAKKCQENFPLYATVLLYIVQKVWNRFPTLCYSVAIDCAKSVKQIPLYATVLLQIVQKSVKKISHFMLQCCYRLCKKVGKKIPTLCYSVAIDCAKKWGKNSHFHFTSWVKTFKVITSQKSDFRA